MTCEMVVMDRSGDSKTTWDPDNPDEVDAARKLFKSLKKKGHFAYSVKGNGEKGTLLQEFDPDAGKIIMSPAMAGG